MLALEGGGLRVFLVPSGSARPIPFGTPAADARAIIDRVSGRGPLETGTIADCAADYARYDNGLVLLIVDGRFVGWTVREESGLTTASGIGIGSTRAQLEDVYSTIVRSTTLGVEFSAGALAGVLAGPEPGARIRHLWAGVACIAR